MNEDRELVLPNRSGADTGLRASIAAVMDAGVAAGNGYLWLRPTRKAARERGLSE